MPIQFLLLGHVREINKSPGNNTRSTIEEELEVEPFPNSWVKFNAHHVVVENVSRELAVK